MLKDLLYDFREIQNRVFWTTFKPRIGFSFTTVLEWTANWTIQGLYPRRTVRRKWQKVYSICPACV
jgi:hypothetical protein